MILQTPPTEEKPEPEIEINGGRQANDTATPDNPFDDIITELGPNVSQYYCFSR